MLNCLLTYWSLVSCSLLTVPCRGIIVISTMSATLKPYSNIFGRIYVFVCLSVCLSDDNFQNSLGIGSSYFHMWYISREYGSCSYMKVIGSSQGQDHRNKRVENSCPCNANLRMAITHILSNIQPCCTFACNMWFSIQQIEWCNCHLCHVTGSEHV